MNASAPTIHVFLYNRERTKMWKQVQKLCWESVSLIITLHISLRHISPRRTDKRCKFALGGDNQSQDVSMWVNIVSAAVEKSLLTDFRLHYKKIKRKSFLLLRFEIRQSTVTCLFFVFFTSSQIVNDLLFSLEDSLPISRWQYQLLTGHHLLMPWLSTQLNSCTTG